MGIEQKVVWECPVCELKLRLSNCDVNSPIRHQCTDYSRYLELLEKKNLDHARKEELAPTSNLLSLVITSHNEGEHLRSTIKSAKSTSGCEVIVVDDGSDDGSCIELSANHVVCHSTRHGIAVSRSHGAAYATGKCIGFADAHHEFTNDCLNRCAELALQMQCIVWPCIRGMEDSRWNNRAHGARIAEGDRKRRQGMPGVGWVQEEPKSLLGRSFGMFVPYFIPREIYPKVKWHNGMRDFGGSELAVAVKAWFQEIDILHSCGSFARHLFRKKAPYTADDRDCIHNIALTCRICFTQSTWENHWWPSVFKEWLKEEDYYQPEILIQQKEFEQYKLRSDSEFWRGLMLVPCPQGVSDN